MHDIDPTGPIQKFLGLLVVATMLAAIARRFDVKWCLLLGSLLLGCIALRPNVIVIEFLATFTNEKFVIPLCTAMGFSHVLKHTGCDQHLVHLLVKPLTKVRWLLVPGTVLVGFLVNMPIVSQTSTAATLGPVVIPILRCANLSPLTAGAALLLGSSIGGELLNPGAPELITTIQKCKEAAVERGVDPSIYDSDRCVRRILPLNFLALLVGTLVFWAMSSRETLEVGAETIWADDFRVDRLKAMVPLVPLALLYVTSFPLHWVEIPPNWIENPQANGTPSDRFQTRLIGVMMLVGVVVAALASPRKSEGVTRAFFDGAGYGFGQIVSVIVVANCFGAAIKLIGFADLIRVMIHAAPQAIVPLAGTVSLAFAALCGSGMATAQSLFGFFAGPALDLGIDPTQIGAVVSVASAAGRTMSPFAAVTLCVAAMTETGPFALAKRVAAPLLLSTAAVIVLAMLSR
jgi:DcuC family C4-dicarboxylate transporter